MRALVAIGLISFLPFMAYAALSTGPYDPVSKDIVNNLNFSLNGNINIPFSDAVAANSVAFPPIDPTKAAGLGVAGATGGLTHPACVAETIRRTSEEQPPPHGDFPCVVPTSNASGIVDGVCFVYECRGVASTGLGGLLSALGGISSLGSIVSGILGKLMQKEPSADNPSTAAATPPTTPPPASELLATDQFEPLDMSKLFNDSADIVRGLLSALNP